MIMAGIYSYMDIVLIHIHVGINMIWDKQYACQIWTSIQCEDFQYAYKIQIVCGQCLCCCRGQISLIRHVV